MPRPIPQRVAPKTGDPGDKFTVAVTGDVLTDAVECDFGPGIDVAVPKVIHGGEGENQDRDRQRGPVPAYVT